MSIIIEKLTKICKILQHRQNQIQLLLSLLLIFLKIKNINKCCEQLL